MSINDKLGSKLSNFQPKRSKLPYENTANYQNSMKQNRMNPKMFSIYKILDGPKGSASDYIAYVDGGYVESGYVPVYDKFNPPSDPL
jgi:hypothetical protein